ncbi:addiction module antidote protein, HigA family [Notoacmeibacter marinus]|uniref:Addiction module antidote protein, HigA family n=1 Tax=Notoacmeibacter marinus TaxID=1876515 RepID=A0A231V0K4_9HYPH|nr:HigA family addiction module antitoxin [Notoacmeibacter marinus]OXT01644.1 addiction module antidote protein, HigA family [Notoacmeibacter marinus]
MTMKNPCHPGELVKSDLEALKLSVAKGADALGVTRSQLHRVIKGDSAISPEMAVRLEAVIGGSADTWLRMQSAYDLAQLRNGKINPAKGLKRIPVPADAPGDQARA